MAQCDSGFERISGDRYFTPMWAAEPVPISSRTDSSHIHPIIDPSAGVGTCGFAVRAEKSMSPVANVSPTTLWAW